MLNLDVENFQKLAVLDAELKLKEENF